MGSVDIIGIARRLLLPLVVSVVSGLVFFFAGDAYRAVGLAAFDNAQKIVSYILGVSVFLSAAMLVERLTRLVIFDSIIAVGIGTPVPRLLKQMASIVIYLTAFAAILSVVFKQDLTVLWAASGVAGLVLGMALKELLGDVISGLALNIDRPIRIGDYVQIHRAGDSLIEGRILEINWRSTRVQDLSDNLIIVPNNKLASATTTNLSQPTPLSEMRTGITVDAAVPHERVMRILLAAATEAWSQFQAPGDRPPSVSLRAVTPHGIEYDIFYYCDLGRRARGRNQILQHALRHLRQAGLHPAMPKLERVDAPPPVWRSPLPQQDEIARLFAASPGLHGLGEEAARLLARHARIRFLAAGQTLVQAGEAGDSAFVVIEGLLQSQPGRKGAAPRPLQPGAAIGLAVALTGEPHTATVRSQTECTLCELGLPAFQALFAVQPQAAALLSHDLAAAMSGESGKGPGEAEEVEAIAADILRTIRRNASWQGGP